MRLGVAARGTDGADAVGAQEEGHGECGQGGGEGLGVGLVGFFC